MILLEFCLFDSPPPNFGSHSRKSSLQLLADRKPD